MARRPLVFCALSTDAAVLKARQKLGKYRIEQRLALGGFATVYKAMDTIEGIRVALKVPHTAVLNDRVLDDFRKEARLTARLEHPNIQPLKDASFIEGRFVIVTPLGDETLSDRLRRRMSLATALDLLEQMLEAVAYAHRQRVIHCDIKPENFLLFSGNRVRLTDFGISKVARKTIAASGSGTVGYMAPEQAMGRPSLRSDVFSLGLLLYRMLTGELPEWPYRWPPPAIQTLRRKVHPDLIAVIRRAVEVVPRRRYRDADRMLAAYKPARSKTLRRAAARRGLLGGTTSRRRRGRAS